MQLPVEVPIEAGWVELDFSASTPLLEFAGRLGSPVPSRAGGPVNEIVLSVPAEEARPNSLSRRHGLNPLPLHTDGAHHVIPPRWIVMRQVAGTTSVMSTLLASVLPLRREVGLWKRLLRTTCVVDDGRRAFAGRIATENEKAHRVRWDPGCMTPSTPADDQNIREMIACLECQGVTEYEWSTDRLLVIDNWAVLHGRSESTACPSVSPRALERVLVQDRSRGA